MFNDRAYTEITKAEYAQTERALLEHLTNTLMGGN